MPAHYNLTWDGKNRRWRKFYKGKRYVVSCRKLNAPETKEASYQQANAWWQQKKAEIDGHITRPSYGGVLDKLEFRRDWCLQHGQTEEATLWDRRIKEILKHEDTLDLEVGEYLLSPGIHDRIHDIEAQGGKVPDFDPLSMEYQLGDGRVWHDREQSQELPPRQQTVSSKIDEFLLNKKSEAAGGQIKVTSYLAVRDRLPSFKNYAGELDASKIDERTLSTFHQHLLTKIAEDKLSPRYAANLLSACKTFIRWLWRERTIEHLPRNLDTTVITVGQQEIPTFTIEEVKQVLDNAVDKTRLYLLLMINCGMYQSDVANLRKSQVDLSTGRIVRKRSKTERHINVPTVSYLLWDETLRLLNSHLSTHPTLALTNEDGLQLVRASTDAKSRIDNINVAYQRTCKKLDIHPKPLMFLRKTSATLIETHTPHYVEEYLGHAPTSLSKQRYARTDQVGFDGTIRWLGSRYGYPSSR